MACLNTAPMAAYKNQTPVRFFILKRKVIVENIVLELYEELIVLLKSVFF